MSLGIRTYGNAQQDDKAVQDNIKKYGVPQGPFAVPVRPDSRKAGTNVEDVRNWQRYVPYLVEKTLTPGSELSPDEQSALPSALNVMGYDAATLPQPGSQLAALMQQLGIGGGRGSSTSSADRQAAAERAALNEWYRSGGHLAQFETLRGALTNQTAAARKAAQGQYDTALGNILSGYGAANNMIGTGYNAVADYLRNNMPNAFAGYQAPVASPEQVSQGYFGAYGVDSSPVQAQIAADQMAGQYGANNFTALVDLLNRTTQQSAASRQAELELARNMGMQTLAQQRAAMESNAAASLQQLLGQISQTEQDKLYQIAADEAAVQAEADKSQVETPAERKARLKREREAAAKAKAKAEAEAKAKAVAAAKAGKGGKGNKGGKK
jgi:hypothetical protein